MRQQDRFNTGIHRSECRMVCQLSFLTDVVCYKMFVNLLNSKVFKDSYLMSQPTVGIPCAIQGCRNKDSTTRKVRLIKQIDDYEIPMKICARHENHFAKDNAIISV